MTRRYGKAWTCQCGAQVPEGNECPDCSRRRPGRNQEEQALVGTHCLCGSKLTFDARCEKTGHYPRMTQARDGRGDWQVLPVKCPFFCPICRARLKWHGGCFECFGTTTGKREDWTFPGADYERQGAHFVKVQEPGRKACTPEENKANLKNIMAILAKSPLMQPVPAVVVDENAGW